MRITNRIMQKNNLSNINTNKIYQDKLSTQMSSQKKISRPSEDPVVAIRSLRLRSNVTEITQYYSKNIPDAESWLKVTEDALANLSQVITNMISQCTTGSNGDLTTANRQIILEQLKKLSEEVYSTGDADYAGRYVFTGYRTDTSLSFFSDQTKKYSLTEQLDKSAIDTITKVDTGKLLDINAANYQKNGNEEITEQDIFVAEAYRIRLAYNDCSGYAEYDEAQAQMNELKNKLKSYSPYFQEVGFDISGLDLDNLTQDDLDRIKEAVAALRQRVEDIENDVVTPGPIGGGSTSGPGTGNGGSIDVDVSVILDWTKLDENTLQELEKWGDDWAKAEEDIAGIASPVIEFTDTDGKINVWKGFAGASSAADATDDAVTETGVITLMHSYENPYAYVAPVEGDDEATIQAKADRIVYVPETGELLFGANRYEKLMSTRDREYTPNINEAEIRITYEKENWEKGDLRPEHYFACTTYKKDENNNDVEDITYNADYLEDGAERQKIEYDVGYNQSIHINSTADECFKHGIGRETDDLIAAMQDVLKLEDVQSTIKELMENTSDEDQLKILQNQLDAVDKALTYAKDKEQRMFESGITAFQKYLDDTNLCVTDCGARGSKLALIKNREQNQKTTYETLKSENEDIDITEVAIQLSAAELTYDAALMAAGKVMQTTLLNFI